MGYWYTESGGISCRGGIFAEGCSAENALLQGDPDEKEPTWGRELKILMNCSRIFQIFREDEAESCVRKVFGNSRYFVRKGINKSYVR